MGKDSGIAWTNHTFNPWEGCAKVSPGCTNCYAETRDGRYHDGKHWGPKSPRLMHVDSYWRQPLKWNREAEAAGQPARVFCASLSDVFEWRSDLDAARARLFDLIERTPWLDWLLLTKRPENMPHLTPKEWASRWPANVWAGATAENEEMLDFRAKHLRHVPAVVRFLSCEPLLEPISVGPYLTRYERVDGYPRSTITRHQWIDWVITGGESGTKARRYHVQWARNIIEECDEAGVPVFHKQLGANAWDLAERSGEWPLVGSWVDGHVGITTNDKAGEDPSEWPLSLRRREWPAPLESELPPIRDAVLALRRERGASSAR